MVLDLRCPSIIIVRALDYVRSLLVTKPFSIMQDIVDSVVHESIKEQMTEYLTAITSFLKYRYSKYATKITDICVTHDLKYVLCRDLDFDKTVGTVMKYYILCTQRRFLFCVCYKVRNLVTDPNMANNDISASSNHN